MLSDLYLKIGNMIAATNYVGTVDGELVHYGAIDECPAVPVCAEPER